MDKKIGVAQSAIILRNDGRLLTMLRSKTAPSRPLHWDLPGGALKFGEDITKGILREIREETGLKVRGLKVLDVCSGTNYKKQFRVTICYVTKPVSERVKLSYEHVEFKWIKPKEFLKLRVSPTKKHFIKKFLSLLIRK